MNKNDGEAQDTTHMSSCLVDANKLKRKVVSVPLLHLLNMSTSGRVLLLSMAKRRLHGFRRSFRWRTIQITWTSIGQEYDDNVASHRRHTTNMFRPFQSCRKARSSMGFVGFLRSFQGLEHLFTLTDQWHTLQQRFSSVVENNKRHNKDVVRVLVLLLLQGHFHASKDGIPSSDELRSFPDIRFLHGAREINGKDHVCFGFRFLVDPNIAGVVVLFLLDRWQRLFRNNATVVVFLFLDLWQHRRFHNIDGVVAFLLLDF